MSNNPCRILVAVTVVLSASLANAQQELNWAQKMFRELNHDFGTVASGSDTRHYLEIKNIYKEDIRIVHVGTTCGCTAAKPSQDVLTTGETAYVEVVMNTVKFKRQKNSNVDVTVSFTDARGVSSSKTVRIPISAYIRPDIVVEPGSIDFGTVDVGAGARRTARVSYAGRSNWNVRGVTVNNDNLEAQVVETQRSRGYGGDAIVKYDLIVQVKPSAPVGVIRDKINLQTDDASNPIVPVLVEARVEPDIVVSPTKLALGDVAAGSERTYRVVIKGKKPFAIERIECESDEERFKVLLSRAAKLVHVLPLTFSSPDEPGSFHEEFTVTVAGRDQPVTFSAVGNIVASTNNAASGH